jgi:hypothetical protein
MRRQIVYFEIIRGKEVCAHDHHGFSPVLKSVSDHGEKNTLPSATSTWAKANDCKNRKHTCYISHWEISTPIQKWKNIFHKSREISILTIKKKTARLTLLQEATERTKQGETKNEKHTPRYEQKCQSHTCSGTINSSMYDSDLTIIQYKSERTSDCATQHKIHHSIEVSAPLQMQYYSVGFLVAHSWPLHMPSNSENQRWEHSSD